MKQVKFLAALVILSNLISCSDNDYRYIDLNTGKRVNIVKDSATGAMINAETKQPILIYYDTRTKDTLYGKAGIVINNKVIRTSDGKFTYEADDLKIKTEASGETKIKEGDYKKKVQDDGDVKIKDGDTKIKQKANGDYKVKKD